MDVHLRSERYTLRSYWSGILSSLQYFEALLFILFIQRALLASRRKPECDVLARRVQFDIAADGGRSLSFI